MSNPPGQTTLYELLEIAKARSTLKNSQQGISGHPHQGSFAFRSPNSVQFNQNLASVENSSIKFKKKIPIRISSLKRETKTAQTLRWIVQFIYLFITLLHFALCHFFNNRKWFWNDPTWSTIPHFLELFLKRLITL